MPAYNAAKTLEQTVAEVPPTSSTRSSSSTIASRDDTVDVARRLGLPTSARAEPRLRRQPEDLLPRSPAQGRRHRDHAPPDYQYTPKLHHRMASHDRLTSELYDVVLGSRILGGGALAGGMPLLQVRRQPLPHRGREHPASAAKLSEYHTGYRAFSPPGAGNAAAGARTRDDFVFDNQMLAQVRLVRLPHRRDHLPDAVLRGGVVDQLPAQRDLRAGGVSATDCSSGSRS